MRPKKKHLEAGKAAIADKLTGNDSKRNLRAEEDHKYCAEIIEKKFSQQNKVLGNIEKFA